MLRLASLFSLSVAAASSFLPASSSNWTRVLLTDAAERDGAVALDGSPQALYLRAGSSSSFVLFFEGGGWCQSLPDCAARANTSLGSSRFPTSGYSARDLLSTDCALNPRLCNHSMVYAQYLDGASRASDAAQPAQVGGQTVYFRGHRTLRAALSALLAPQGPGGGLPSLAAADELVVTGSSAGGLTVLLHADEIAAAVAAANPRTRVRAVAEVGFFIDGQSIWGGARIRSGVFARVAGFGNVTGGAPAQVNAACVAATPPALRARCFMAQYTLPHIATPTFVVNSRVDEWQAQNILAPNLDTLPAVTTYAPFAPCIHAPVSGCNATQAAQWRGLAGQFLDALAGARAATPPAAAAGHGGVITSCPIHTTLIGGLGHRIRVGGRSLYQHVVDWLDAGDKSQWVYDVYYPGNDSCPKPSEYRDDWRGM